MATLRTPARLPARYLRRAGVGSRVCGGRPAKTRRGQVRARARQRIRPQPRPPRPASRAARRPSAAALCACVPGASALAKRRGQESPIRGTHPRHYADDPNAPACAAPRTRPPAHGVWVDEPLRDRSVGRRAAKRAPTGKTGLSNQAWPMTGFTRSSLLVGAGFRADCFSPAWRGCSPSCSPCSALRLPRARLLRMPSFSSRNLCRPRHRHHRLHPPRRCLHGFDLRLRNRRLRCRVRC